MSNQSRRPIVKFEMRIYSWVHLDGLKGYSDRSQLQFVLDRVDGLRDDLQRWRKAPFSLPTSPILRPTLSVIAPQLSLT